MSLLIRKNVLGQFYYYYGNLYLTTTCFVCLYRPPEHILSCRYTLYNNYITIFGRLQTSAEYFVELTRYSICKNKYNIVIHQLPPTKRPIILSLDREDIRGLIQLGLLCVLERYIGIPIGSLPDYYIGTNIGKSA